MTKFQMVKEIEGLAKDLGYNAWGFYRCSLGVCYDKFTKAEISAMRENLIIEKYGKPF